MDTILIVDDSKTIQKQVTLFANKHYPQMKVVAANSGEDALMIIPDLKDNVAVAIFDYNMDGITGLELIEKAKEYISLKKIVLCTANVQETIQSKAGQTGVRFKEKPLTIDSFKEVVDSILEANK